MATSKINLTICSTFPGEKLAEGDSRWGKFNYGFYLHDVTAKELAVAIKKGHSFAAAMKSHHRDSKEFISGQHIGLDFDTEDERSSIEYLLTQSLVKEYATIIYPTPSSQPDKPRTRVIFFLDQPVSDIKAYDQYIKALTAQFPWADTQAAEPARFWYGTKDANVLVRDNVLPIEVIKSLPVLPVITTPESTPTAEPTGKLIPNKQRNTTLFRMGSSLQSKGWSDEAILAALLEQNRTACETPLEDPEVEKIAKSISKRYEKGMVIETLYKTPIDRPDGWTVDELLTTKFPPPHWVIPNLLCEGLTILGGRPKIGKSWMALQLALAVGSGDKFLGFQAPKGKVLYIAYEDNETRLQGRMEVQQANMGTDCRIYTMGMWPFFHQGGYEKLVEKIEEDGYKVVIIDTLSRAYSGIDQKEAFTIGPQMVKLQELAMAKHILIIIIDHFRKNPTGDPVADVMDTTAKSASADAIMGLYKNTGELKGQLKVVGRATAEMEYQLTWDGLHGKWANDGVFAEVKGTDFRKQLVDLLEANGELTAGELAEMTGKQSTNVGRELKTLLENRIVVRRKEGREFIYHLQNIDKSDNDDKDDIVDKDDIDDKFVVGG